MTDLTPLTDASVILRMSRERLLRRLQSGEIQGEKIAGRWFVRLPEAAAADNATGVTQDEHAPDPLEQVADAETMARITTERVDQRMSEENDYEPQVTAAIKAHVRDCPKHPMRRLEAAIREACEIIERGDDRLLASDGPAGGQPPDLSLQEWRRLYTVLRRVRSSEKAR